MDSISAERIARLHPAIRHEVHQIFGSLELSPNTVPRITQGFRTFPEQQALYDQGRSKPGKIVTNARAGTSFHNYGLAFDFVLIKEGKASWKVDEDWKAVVAAFKKAGYSWGGDWASFKDFPHVEKTFGYSWKQLLAKHQRSDFIDESQYVKL